MLGTILIVVLILALLGAFPAPGPITRVGAMARPVAWGYWSS